MVFRFVLRPEHIVGNNIDREGGETVTKTWEEVPVHCTVGEDWVLAPGLKLGPRIPIQGSV